MIRRLRYVFLTIVGLAILAALSGAAYQSIESRAEARRSPEAGRPVDIGGYLLKINCTGNGSPTVILEARLGDVSIEWSRVQPEIAKLARVCSYDRAGYGSSNAGPIPRTNLQIAKKLHTLLQNAREAPPYLLVVHSFGGYNVRVFNGNYPDELSGIVLVDSTQEDQYELLPPAWGKIYSSELRRQKRQAMRAPVFVDLGVARWMYGARFGGNAYLILQSKYRRARASELESIKTSAEQARAAGNISDKPLIVLTGGKNSGEILSNSLTRQDFDEFRRIWVEQLQRRLAPSPLEGNKSPCATADTIFRRNARTRSLTR